MASYSSMFKLDRLAIVHPLCYLLTALLFTATAAQASPDRPEWDDPSVFQVNTLPARASFMPFDTREQALRHVDSPKASSRYASLALSLIHISEPTRPFTLSRMPSSA